MKLFTITALTLLTFWQPALADGTIVYCQFEGLPGMTMTLRGGMGASDNTLQIGSKDPVQLSIGSSLSSASMDGNSYTIAWQYPASVTVSGSDGSNSSFTRYGECSSDMSIFSPNQENLAIPANVSEYAWDEVEICSAAMQTYFFLDSSPSLIQENAKVYEFRSQAGNVYSCFIARNVVAFEWINRQGEKMFSSSTQFSVAGATLRIVSDLQTKTFTLPK